MPTEAFLVRGGQWRQRICFTRIRVDLQAAAIDAGCQVRDWNLHEVPAQSVSGRAKQCACLILVQDTRSLVVTEAFRPGVADTPAQGVQGQDADVGRAIAELS